MPIQDAKQLDQCQWWLGLTVFVQRKGIGAATKEIGRLALIKCELFADCGDVPRVYIGCIDLALELTDALAVAIAVFLVEDHFVAGWTKITCDRRNRGGFTFVGVGQIARIVDQFRRAAAWAFHCQGFAANRNQRLQFQCL